MIYFTILHVITLVILLLLFIILFILTLRESNKKIFYSMLFANFLAISTLAFFSMLVLDKYTKKAKILQINQKRILINETITFNGKVQNIGNFTIGHCSLEIKLIDNPVNSIDGTSVFKPNSGFNFISKTPKPSTISHEFTIAKTLKPNEIKTFSVSMPFPPYFKKASTYQYLTCH